MCGPLVYALDMSTDHRFACIIIDDEPLGHNSGGSQPVLIANQPVLARQIALLRSAGFSDIIVLEQGSSGQRSQKLRDLGPFASVTSVSQLLERIADNQSVLLMGEGCLPSLELLQQMRAVESGAILVRDAATSDDRHERIDLNDRFAGMLMMPNTALGNVPAMEADWSLLSMILRHAVQLNFARMPIPIGPMEPLRCDSVKSADEAEKWQFRVLEAHIADQSATASPLRRWLLLPLAQMALPTLWSKGAQVLRYLPYAGVGLGAIAMLLAWLAWPIAAIVFLLSAFVCDEIVAQSRDFSPSPLGGSELHWAGVGISLLFSPWLVLWSGSMPSNLAAVLAGGLVSLAFLQQNLGHSAANAIWVGAFEAMVLAIAALIAGLSVGTTALLVAAIVLLQNVWRPLASRLKTI